MRVLVTGGAGFIGSHLCDRLVDAGREVVVVDDLSLGLKRNIAHLLERPNFEFHEFSILDSTFEALGKAHLDDLNERFAVGLPEPDDYDTIGGFIISQLGRIPRSGESIIYGQVRITVLESTRRRIERVRLERLAEPQPETV